MSSDPSIAAHQKRTRTIVGGAVGGIITLILLCSFVLVYLRRRYSKAATSSNVQRSSQTTFGTSEDVGDHLHPIDPFPPPLPVIGMISLTITS